jgi:predicted dehydrogenase
MQVAVLGTGGMGETIIQHLRTCERVSAIFAYDIRAERTRELAARYGVEAATRLERILDDPAVPLVFVASSNDSHCDLVTRALAAGKSVMCEKPIATTLRDSQRVVRESERRNAFLQIGFECRYSRLYSTVKEWIDGGLLGNIVNTHCYYVTDEFHLKGSWRNKLATGGSLFGEKLCHYVDLVRWWVGAEVDWVLSCCAPNIIPYYEVHDNYHTTYRFKNGAASHLTFMMGPAASIGGDPLTQVPKEKDDSHHLRYMIVGTAGFAETSAHGRFLRRWEYVDTEACQSSVPRETIRWAPEENQRYYHNTLEQTKDIVRRVAEGLPPKTAARDSLETMLLVFAAEESASRDDLVRMDDLRQREMA